MMLASHIPNLSKFGPTVMTLLPFQFYIYVNVKLDDVISEIINNWKHFLDLKAVKKCEYNVIRCNKNVIKM